MAEQPGAREGVVLYNGSLDELNSRDPRKQYKFTDQLRFETRWYDVCNLNLAENWGDKIKKDFESAGIDGLVNVRTMRTEYSLRSFEGTPIVRVK